jgi:hypothetical protein
MLTLHTNTNFSDNYYTLMDHAIDQVVGVDLTAKP